MTDNAALREAADALRDADGRYQIHGTSQERSGYIMQQFSAPWFLVDGSTAELDVGWLGERLGEYPTAQDAAVARYELIARAAIDAYLAARGDVQAARGRVVVPTNGRLIGCRITGPVDVEVETGAANWIVEGNIIEAGELMLPDQPESWHALGKADQ